MKTVLPKGDITQLLEEFRSGQSAAANLLIPIVYRELHRNAARYLARERRDHSLQPTALVNEAFLRLFSDTTIEWQNRAHFFAVSAQVMRRILVDYARSRRAHKRGGPFAKVSLDEAMVGSFARPEDILIVDEALNRLAKFDARQARVVEMRFFAGLSEEETAEVLGVSTRTIKRDWRLARAWLYDQLSR